MKRSICTELLLLIILLFTFSRCDDNKENIEPVVANQIKKLMGRWKPVSVKLDGAMQEGWENFILRVSPVAGAEKLSYVIENNPYRTVWISTATGNFTFDEIDPEEYLVREDGVRIEYLVTEGTMSMRFTYQETQGGGRGSGVGGAWEFAFEKMDD